MRKTIAVLILLISASFGNAQIKVEGPKEATTGYRVKAKLTLDVVDPKIQCFPANDDWFAVQDFSGNKFIDFVPGKKSVPEGAASQLFTFVIAGNKEGKTYLELWEVTVKPDGDVIPKPKPKPEPDEAKSQLYKDLLAAYKVSPSATARTTLIEGYTAFLDEVKADKYVSASFAGKALADKFANLTELHGVRDVVADYLQKHAGQTWNKTKVVDAMTTVIATLKTIPE